ncbi:MAG: hypothetical protein ACLFP2_02035 [Candidatus Woesearchaeota archaeon]
MRVDTAKPREQLFRNPTVHEICSQYINKERIRIDDLEGEVITREGSIEGLKQGQYTIDDHLAVETLKKSPDLCILPGDYRINQGQARNLIAYSLDSLILLDSMPLKRQLIDGNVPKNPLSKRQKRIFRWYPEKVIPARIDQLDDMTKNYSCLSWWGSDNHRRILSFYRMVQGVELFAFNELARLKLEIPLTKKELRTGKTRYKTGITYEERMTRKKWLEDTMKYLKTHSLFQKIRQLDVGFSDFIEVKKPFSHGTGQNVRVPSRSQPPMVYDEKLTGTLLTIDHDALRYSEAWEIRGRCYCKDKGYRSDRRKRKGQGQDEDFFCAHEIAGFLATYKRYQEEPERIYDLPFFIPNKETIKYLDKLRNETIMLCNENGKLQKRSLNNTEMENLLIKKFIHDGFNECADFNYDQDFKLTHLYLT